MEPQTAPETRDRLAPLDRWTVAYAAFVAGLVLLRRPPGLVVPLLAAQALLAAVALLAPRLRRRGRLGLFVGDFYPLLLDFLLYTEVGLLNRAAGVSHDALVQGWDAAIFGGQPALDWIRARPSPWLASVLHGAYLSLYPILALGPLGLWLTGRRLGARRTVLLAMATFYLCYAVFLLFPVAGPRYLYALPENEATRTAVAGFAYALVEAGSAWGTAFPSSHVAVSLVTAVSTALAWPALGAPLVVVAVLLAFGTVYGQFHYASDGLAGAALALLVLALRRRIWRGIEGD